MWDVGEEERKRSEKRGINAVVYNGNMVNAVIESERCKPVEFPRLVLMIRPVLPGIRLLITATVLTGNLGLTI